MKIANNSMTNHEQNYIPGVCNIGEEERKARKTWPTGLFILLLASIILLQIFTANHLWRLLIFFPAAGFGITFQQWYLGFCVSYGSKGLYNFGPLGKPNRTNSEDDLQKDRAKVRKMVIAGIVFGALLSVLYYILPI